MANITVNGEKRTFSGDPNMPLLWYLRDEVGLTGTKFGCGVGACGACTIHLDGEAVRSCLTTIDMADGKSVTTIEGLSPDGEHAVQKAWRQLSVPQCGYCQAGQIMQAAALLTKNRAPSDRADRGGDVRQSLPMRLLSAHPCGGSSCGGRSLIMLHYLEQEARKAQKPRSVATIENVSRRQFVGGVLMASGLVLAVRIAPASALEALKPYKTGGLTCRTATAWPTIRTSTLRSPLTAPSPSSRIAPRWAPASERACPW